MKKIGILIKAVWKAFIDDGCLYRASSLAFTSLLAIVPLVSLSVLMLSRFPVMQTAGQKVEDFLFSNLVPSSTALIQQHIATFSEQALKMSWLGLLALLVIVVLLLFSIENALNKIWKLNIRPGRFAVLRAIGRHWLLVLLIPIMLSASLFIYSYISTIHLINQHLSWFSIKYIADILILLIFTVLFKFMPAVTVRLRHAFVGALVSTVLFEMLKNLFLLYVYFVPVYRIIYGAFAAIPLFLIWIYLLWSAILLGAEVAWYLGSKSRRSYHRH